MNTMDILTEEDLTAHYSLDGIYEEVINYENTSEKLDNKIYSDSFQNLEKNYLQNNLM